GQGPAVRRRLWPCPWWGPWTDLCDRHGPQPTHGGSLRSAGDASLNGLEWNLAAPHRELQAHRGGAALRARRPRLPPRWHQRSDQPAAVLTARQAGLRKQFELEGREDLELRAGDEIAVAGPAPHPERVRLLLRHQGPAGDHYRRYLLLARRLQRADRAQRRHRDG